MQYLRYFVIELIVLEMISIVIVSSFIGIGWTLIIMSFFIMIGITLLKRQGANWQKIVVKLQQNDFNQSWYQKIGPIRYSIAALLFICPGFFSNLIGIALLIPKNLSKFMQQVYFYKKTQYSQDSQSENHIIEGKFKEIHKKKKSI